MVMGIGTDILKLGRILGIRDPENDPFIHKTYTQKERAQAILRPDPLLYYATRFAGKEAVFKSLGIPADGVRLNEIEILSNDFGQPIVELLGSLKEKAGQKGIRSILLSLSYDTDYAVAYAIALGQ